ncbi:hypothetical protein GGS23DRAFT_71163 [Durotheca rogersii]|uniref:uncharacterized protein n=1 Tax=Durotheca rogersii TaxID=419775 RepID=UPI0022206E4E|nr:uncharacterized protein GGS23DRAFT_71163 [Durotheca rogersii]KAI5862844.1 hypothetical protein GGS23DRAFT_71163 [Durotheca rogersii]
MAARQEFSAPRKKGLMTYGKASRKRQPKAAFNPVWDTDELEDDPIPKPKATVTHRRPTLISSPVRQPPSPSRRVDGVVEGKGSTSGPQKGAQPLERKRKISQVDTSRGRAQEAAQAGKSSQPLNRTQRRPRPSAPTRGSAVSSVSKERAWSITSESIEADATETKLSSPPLTPTLPNPPRRLKAASANDPGSSTSTSANAARETKRESVRKQIALRFASVNTAALETSSAPSAGADEKIQLSPPWVPERVSKRRRKRLIDALVEQTQDEADGSIDEVFESQATLEQPAASQQAGDVPTMDSQTLPQTPSRKTATMQLTGARTFARSNSGLKFTYGQGRKLLEEEGDLLEALTLPGEMSLPLKGRRLELGAPIKTAAAKGVLDDDDLVAQGSPNSKLRNIHELRQAGANSRVADTMQDLADQIGTPGNGASSSRRAALLQVAEKIKDRDFMRQYRDHGVEAAFLKDMGKESDPISGYLILSILVTTLAKWPSSHINQLVRLENPASLFAHFLGVPRDMKFIARDRRSNLSKRSQTSVLAIQSSLRELPIWDAAKPPYVSPRGIALKCLHLLITQDINTARDPAIFSPAVIEALFAVLSEAAENTDYWSYPATSEAIEFAHALSILDFYAVSVAESQRASSDWAARYLPTVADIFSTSSGKAVSEAAAEGGDGAMLEGAVLKLTINLANNSAEAPEIFVAKGLIPALAESITSNFARIWASLSQDAWVDGILDSLVLRLGILINFSEHSSLVRQVINDCRHEGQRPVDELIRLFLENYRRTAEADSMETSHLNVAFGYLSVLLGYLALYAPVRQKIRSGHSTRSIEPLLDSIREFIIHHRKVESADVGEDGTQDQSGYTERLQDLVHRLEDQAAHD